MDERSPEHASRKESRGGIGAIPVAEEGEQEIR